MPPMRYEIAAPDVEEWSVVEAGDNDWGPAGGVSKKADAHLIANAPTWLAQLLAALEASERENERMREALEEIAVADGRNGPVGRSDLSERGKDARVDGPRRSHSEHPARPEGGRMSEPTSEPVLDERGAQVCSVKSWREGHLPKSWPAARMTSSSFR